MLGFWSGYEFLSPWVGGMASHAHADVGMAPTGWMAWLAVAIPWIVAVATGVAGLVLSRRIDRVDAAFSRFNQAFNAFTRLYGRTVGRLLRVSAAVLAGRRRPAGSYLVGLHASPRRVHPHAGQGLFARPTGPPNAASVERTAQVMQRIEEIAAQTAGVKDRVGIAGQSLLLAQFEGLDSQPLQGLCIRLWPCTTHRSAS